MRGQFLAEIDDWLGPGWMAPPLPATVGSKPAADHVPPTRVALRDALRLADDQLPSFVDDGLDMLRVAYRRMVPVMAVPDEFHRVVACVGPGARIYTVSIKEREVEPPPGAFTSHLVSNLEQLVVG